MPSRGRVKRREQDLIAAVLQLEGSALSVQEQTFRTETGLVITFSTSTACSDTADGPARKEWRLGEKWSWTLGGKILSAAEYKLRFVVNM